MFSMSRLINPDYHFVQDQANGQWLIKAGKKLYTATEFGDAVKGYIAVSGYSDSIFPGPEMMMLYGHSLLNQTMSYPRPDTDSSFMFRLVFRRFIEAVYTRTLRQCAETDFETAHPACKLLDARVRVLQRGLLDHLFDRKGPLTLLRSALTTTLPIGWSSRSAKFTVLAR